MTAYTTAGPLTRDAAGSGAMQAIRPSIAPAVQRYIAEEIALARGVLNGVVPEVTFACTWDPAAKQITGAQLMARGGRNHSLTITPALPRALIVVLHNHPSDVLEPSEGDLKAAISIANDGFGLATCSSDATRLYVIREPVRLRPRLRFWKFGRFALLYEARVR